MERTRDLLTTVGAGAAGAFVAVFAVNASAMMALPAIVGVSFAAVVAERGRAHRWR